MNRPWIGVALTAGMLGLCFALTHDGGEGDRWKKLATKRERVAWMRHMPSFQAYLDRQIGWGVRMAAQPSFLGGFKENTMLVRGILMDGNYPNHGYQSGSFEARYFYQAWNENPASAEYVLVIHPEAAEKIYSPELAALVAKTDQASAGTVSEMMMGSQHWSCMKVKDMLRLVMRTSYPADQMEAIPEYDRGSSDWMEFDIKFKALKFLHTQAFQEGVSYFSYLPVFNPPSGVSKLGLGLTNGVAMKGDRLAHVEMSISGSASGFDYKRTVRLAVKPIGKEGQVADVLQSSFMTSAGKVYDNAVSISNDKITPNQDALYVSFPLGYAIEKLDLRTNRGTTASR